MPHTPGTAITAPVPAAGDAWATSENQRLLCGVKTSVAAAPAVMWPLTNAMI
jgi:hypothetical protein